MTLDLVQVSQKSESHSFQWLVAVSWTAVKYIALTCNKEPNCSDKISHYSSHHHDAYSSMTHLQTQLKTQAENSNHHAVVTSIFTHRYTHTRARAMLRVTNIDILGHSKHRYSATLTQRLWIWEHIFSNFMLLISCIRLHPIYQQMHTIKYRYQTHTCFGTGVPSSGSLLEQRNTSPTRYPRYWSSSPA